jgi:hypothetical protein
MPLTQSAGPRLYRRLPLLSQAWRPPTAYQQPAAGPRLGLPDDTAPQPRSLGAVRRSRGTGPAAMAGSGAV